MIRPLKIVVANDEGFALEATAKILEFLVPNARVSLFENSETAWEVLSREDPDLLITDDAMPGLRGREICERLLARKTRFPIIVNSPWPPTEQWVEECARQGLNVRFLESPFTISQFRTVLEASLKTGAAGKEITKKLPLEDVVEKGAQHYYEGRCFRRWGLIMVHKYGQAMTPHLENAWKILERNARSQQQSNATNPTNACGTRLNPFKALCSWFVSAAKLRGLDESEDAWLVFQREVLCGWIPQVINFVGVLAFFLVVFAAVCFCCLKCGLLGYFLAYFFAFYLPTFWIQIFYLDDFDSIRFFVDWRRGGIAVFLLGAIHVLLLLGWHLNKADLYGSDWNLREHFFIEILPLFLGVNCVISFTYAKKMADEEHR